MIHSSLSIATKRKNRLHELEVIIYANQLKIGEALSEIRENRLYRDEYSSFNEYCQQRWGHNRAWADRLIKSVNLISALEQEADSDLDPSGSALPQNESQARALRGLNTDEQIQVMNDVVASGEKVTAALIEEYAQKYKEPYREYGNDWDEEELTEPEEEEEETEIPNQECNSQETIELLVEHIRQLHQDNAELKKENSLLNTLLRGGVITITWTCRESFTDK